LQGERIASNVLKVESALESLSPDIQLPAVTSVKENRAFEEMEGDLDLPDAEEAEDLPPWGPEEEEDAEVVEAEQNEMLATDMDDDEAINNGEAPNAPDEAVHDPNGRMPGQLPTAATVSVKDYHSIKKAAKEKVAARQNIKRWKFSYEEFLIGMGLLIGAAEFSQKGWSNLGERRMKMMRMTLSSGHQSLLLHTFSNTWLFAILRIFEGFCLQFTPMQIEKKVILGWFFQVWLMNWILLETLKSSVPIGLVQMKQWMSGGSGLLH
jgi:hypothetical protein